ncbi:hypothetical protein B5F40_15700 [Gordonibacter sp. An230]|nr:hypothetical protein B5F40_15700 [Gordonibacter sp. An230]
MTGGGGCGWHEGAESRGRKRRDQKRDMEREAVVASAQHAKRSRKVRDEARSDTAMRGLGALLKNRATGWSHDRRKSKAEADGNGTDTQDRNRSEAPKQRIAAVAEMPPEPKRSENERTRWQGKNAK